MLYIHGWKGFITLTVQQHVCNRHGIQWETTWRVCNKLITWAKAASQANGQTKYVTYKSNIDKLF